MNITGKRTIKNAAWIIGCKVIKAVLTLVITMMTARYLGPSNFGVINYAASLVAFIAPVMQLGLSAIIVRELVKDPDTEGEAMGTTLVLCIISSLLCIGGLAAFTQIANAGERETILVCAIYSVILLFQAFEMVQYWFQANLMSKYSSISMLISYTAVTAVQIALLLLKVSILWYAASYLIEYLVMSALLIIIYKKKSKGKLSFSWKRAKSMLAQSKYYIIAGLMDTIFTQTDKIMIKLMVGDAGVGWYSAAVTCSTMAGFVFAAIIESMRPIIFESVDEDEKLFEKRLASLYSIIIYASLAFSAIMTGLAPIVVRIMYGGEYMPTIGVLRVVVWYTTFSYIGSVRNVWILAKNKQKYLLVINLVGAVMNIAMNFALIPTIGITGAAIASLSTQFFINVLLGFIMRPIRGNNKIMLYGLNPLYMADVFKTVFGKKSTGDKANVTESSKEDSESSDEEVERENICEKDEDIV